MLDKITIHQLAVETIIGTLAFERILKQKLYITIHVAIVADKIAQQDDINSAEVINYDLLSQTIVQFGLDNQFFLLETFAVKLIDQLFSEYPLTEIQVEITKPSALKKAQGVSVVLCRTSPCPA